MSKRKPMDKAQAREHRNKLLASAAEAKLSLTEGVREMRAIAGMTQEEFAKHRGVSARVIKAIELGQGNPTVATLNRIGEFFGLEVAFVPIRHKALMVESTHSSVETRAALTSLERPEDLSALSRVVREMEENMRAHLQRMRDELNGTLSKAKSDLADQLREQMKSTSSLTHQPKSSQAREKKKTRDS